MQAAEAQALAQRLDDGRPRNRQVHAGSRAADDRARARIGPLDARRRRNTTSCTQTTFFMLDHLRVRLNLTEAQIPLALKDYGNLHGLLHVAAVDARPAGSTAACGPARRPC